MSRKTHSALVFFAALALTACQLKITSKTPHGGPNLPSEDPPAYPPGTPGDPPPGQPGLRAVSGDGQVTVTRFAFADPLSVLLTDSYGRAVTGATVTWKSSDTQGALNFTQTSTATDASGVATLPVTAGSIGPTESSRLVTVTATASAEGKSYTRVFYETVALSTPRAFFLASAPVYSVQASSVLQGAIKVAVINATGDGQGIPMPGVALKVTTIYPYGVDPNTLPALGCVGGTVLTDIKGEATCDLAASAQLGTVQISVSVGRFVTYDRSSAEVAR